MPPRHLFSWCLQSGASVENQAPSHGVIVKRSPSGWVEEGRAEPARSCGLLSDGKLLRVLGVLVCLEGVAWMGLCIVEDNGEDVISGVPVP